MIQRLRNPKVAVSIVFVAAMFMSMLDSTIVNVALPSIARQYRVDAANAGAIASAYLVSLAVFIPASAGWATVSGTSGCCRWRWCASPPRPACAASPRVCRS